MKRVASHAGSWYSSDKEKLSRELDGYFDNAVKQFAASEEENTFPIEGVRAIIAPHAGFRYSGPTAAFAYKSVDVSKVQRVFLLGPSHHAYIDGCCLSKCDTYETPFGDMTLDKEVIEELYKTEKFNWMKKSVDEEEHSIEMHLPFTFKIFKDKINNIKLVPILVGAISAEKERLYGEILSKYLHQPENLFIVSSDFCHWGTRFRYTYYTKSDEEEDSPVYLDSDSKNEITRPIYESIQSLDFEGIETLEDLSFDQFQAYLQRTRNTICGRHPIAVLLAALETLAKTKQSSNQVLKCIKYDQSGRCKRHFDSSVSYASIYVKFT